METKPYIHTVQYYETDRMGITHHSNYIRMMEEARLDYLSQIGLPYEKMEATGIISPVTGIDVKYHKTTTFPDKLTIHVSIEEFKGVRLKVLYEIKKEDGSLAAAGHSEHCFLGQDGRPVRLKRDYPDIFEKLGKK